jgi:hypothetical protein
MKTYEGGGSRTPGILDFATMLRIWKVVPWMVGMSALKTFPFMPSVTPLQPPLLSGLCQPAHGVSIANIRVDRMVRRL